jgi:hypothetical protein
MEIMSRRYSKEFRIEAVKLITAINTRGEPAYALKWCKNVTMNI